MVGETYSPEYLGHRGFCSPNHFHQIDIRKLGSSPPLLQAKTDEDLRGSSVSNIVADGGMYDSCLNHRVKRSPIGLGNSTITT